MNSRRLWSNTSRRLTLLLLAVVLPPAVTLIWLGAQLLEQDRDVIAQREGGRRTAVGQAVALQLQKTLSEAELLLDGGTVPDGMTRFVLSDDGVEVSPATRILWSPRPRQLPTTPEAPVCRRGDT